MVSKEGNPENIEDELAKLEAELDEEENEKKKNEPKPQKPKPVDIKEMPDYYPNEIETKYHNDEKMVCLGVLEKEKLLCYKIIKYKKKIEKDYSYWEIKKKNVDKKMKSITSLIEEGTWNLGLYKTKIEEEYELDKKLFESAKNELYLAQNQKETLIDRIVERINILEGEINKAKEQEAENKAENFEDIQKGLEELESEFDDIYPETAEDIYHNLGKFVSLGVLEKEKELCNEIIEYKKNKSIDYKIWDTKKDNIDTKIGSITSLVQEGTWNFDTYKGKIKEQNDWEEKLLQLAENDSSLNDGQKLKVKQRINERIKIIQNELNKKIDEEDE